MAASSSAGQCSSVWQAAKRALTPMSGRRRRETTTAAIGSLGGGQTSAEAAPRSETGSSPGPREQGSSGSNGYYASTAASSAPRDERRKRAASVHAGCQRGSSFNWWKDAVGEGSGAAGSAPDPANADLAKFFEHEPGSEPLLAEKEDTETSSNLGFARTRSIALGERVEGLASAVSEGAGQAAQKANQFASWAISGLSSLGRRSKAEEPAFELVDGVTEADGWTIFAGCEIDPDVVTKDVTTTACQDLQECKQLCLAQGCTGIVLQGGKALFYTVPRAQLLGPARRPARPGNSTAPAAVATLLVAPASDDQELQAEWITAMESNLALLKRVADHHRTQRDNANLLGDTSTAEAAGRDLERVKVQQYRLAAALFHAVGEGRKPGLMATTLTGEEQDLAEALGLTHPASAALPATTPAGKPGASHTDADPTTAKEALVADGNNGVSAPADDYDPLAETVLVRKQADGGLPQFGSAVAAQKLGSNGATAATNLPPPPMGGKAKGGKGAPPVPKGGGKGRATKSPIGRRFHWQGLRPEYLRGTVFDDAPSVGEGGYPASASSRPLLTREPSFNLEALQSLFHADELAAAHNAPKTRPSEPRRSQSRSQRNPNEVCVLNDSRAQHIAIVCRRVFGQLATPDDVSKFVAGLEALDLRGHGQAKAAEDLDLLSTALPTSEEAALLMAAAAEHGAQSLRKIEELVLPMAQLPRAEARLRAAGLQAQAESLQEHLDRRVSTVSNASKQLRSSATVRCLLKAVARLGSWINASDVDAHRGFALSSALDKLHQFRALRGDRGLSLLHVVALSAAGGNPEEVGQLGRMLAEELRALPAAAREDLVDLGMSVNSLRQEANWLLRESACEKEPEVIRCRLGEIHKDFASRAERVEAHWSQTRKDLEDTLLFFAERWDAKQASAGKGSLERTSEAFAKMVEEFRGNICKAAAEIAEQPARFAAVSAAMPNEGGSASEAGSGSQMQVPPTLGRMDSSPQRRNNGGYPTESGYRTPAKAARRASDSRRLSASGKPSRPVSRPRLQRDGAVPAAEKTESSPKAVAVEEHEEKRTSPPSATAERAAVAAEVLDVEPVTGALLARCRSCGAQLLSDDVFCMRCGTQRAPPEAPPAAAKARPSLAAWAASPTAATSTSAGTSRSAVAAAGIHRGGAVGCFPQSVSYETAACATPSPSSAAAPAGRGAGAAYARPPVHAAAPAAHYTQKDVCGSPAGFGISPLSGGHAVAAPSAAAHIVHVDIAPTFTPHRRPPPAEQTSTRR
eukprot:TRINITY_DN13820_c0_g1_i1.p1 TRINITY_DN13820_c0_g1~~TRINITY_DN13820_c0_g1_i1.p1  ORF type:complete len:1262 (-),score=320.10 TRINITY_DN13820_c0_g1_i1:288-4073(-)